MPEPLFPEIFSKEDSQTDMEDGAFIMKIDRQGDALVLSKMERLTSIGCFGVGVLLLSIFGLSALVGGYVTDWRDFLFYFLLPSPFVFVVFLIGGYQHSIRLDPDGFHDWHCFFRWCFEKSVPLSEIIRFERFKTEDSDAPGGYYYAVQMLTTKRFQTYHYFNGTNKKGIEHFVVVLNVHLADLLEKSEPSDPKRIENLRKTVNDFVPVGIKTVAETRIDLSFQHHWTVEESPDEVAIYRKSDFSGAWIVLIAAAAFNGFAAYLWYRVLQSPLPELGLDELRLNLIGGVAFIAAIQVLGIAMIILLLQLLCKTHVRLHRSVVNFSRTCLGIGLRRSLPIASIARIDIAPNENHRRLDMQDALEGPDSELYELRIYAEQNLTHPFFIVSPVSIAEGEYIAALIRSKM